MLNSLKIPALLILLLLFAIIYYLFYQQNNILGIYFRYPGNKSYNLNNIKNQADDNIFQETTASLGISPTNYKNILSQGNVIIFLETTNKLEPAHLVLCAVESAARVYPNRSVILFMKGLSTLKSEDENSLRNRFPTLSSFNNVYIFPLLTEEVFKDTPLLPWYLKVNTSMEKYWTHVLADGCRLALIWKYGGMYFDTDIVSIQPIPVVNFLAAESSKYSSNGALGFSPHHEFIWKCMEDFVRNYKGEVWGQQGPLLLTRILEQICLQHSFMALEDIMCGNITFMNPVRFYSVSGNNWRTFYEVWKPVPIFNNSYGSHFWNYMNHEKAAKVVIPGSNTLAEYLYKQYCPDNYEVLKMKNKNNV
ncbi:alpha-1,4-N-acetylglucosaminyltransferase-like [Bombina bombina]|uniref:alpha-1,4-N-acetylglucosaminyltransferase-like n=1 Tax=Bombina bombina TaxID=8345 RepID=UPI00235AE49D|nr:alpha-1,4-N-acetylglucosaminyltransferase-like [Bombina bombina]XP_053565750.1 alpha-1,4-N-acetylglucosaminyltransferase-like [Bombina bombina]